MFDMRTTGAWVAIVVIVVAGATALLAPAADARGSARFRATLVTIPPKIQQAGATYRLRTRVTNLGGTFKPLCVDFTDDKNSWLIEAPGLRSFDSDAFCAGTLLRGQAKTLTFFVIAAKQGAHRMTVTIGKASVFRELNDIVIDDPNALVWEGNFVIV
jgi:hypothetical protein